MIREISGSMTDLPFPTENIQDEDFIMHNDLGVPA
jgi:hypothetical protein